MMKTIRSWLPAIIAMGVIFMISATPGPAIQQAGLGLESIHINGHFLLFFILCLAYFKATKNAAYSVILSVIYAALDEYHQFFTFERSPSLFDILVDTLGALLAGLLIWKFQHLLPKKLKNWLNN